MSGGVDICQDKWIQTMNRKYIRNCKIIICLLPVSVAGMLCGRLLIHALEISFVSGKSAAVLMAKYPAGNMLSVSSALSDPDPAVRIAGYYGACDGGFITTDIMVKRLEKEKDPIVRKVMVSLLYGMSKTEYRKVIKNHPELEIKKGRTVNNPSSIL